MTRAIFLDRDNTVIEDPGYINRPDLVKLLSGAADAIRRLRAAGYKIVIVTNQSGIARGMLSEDMLGEIHRELRRQLVAAGADVDAIYYCPFHPDGTVARYKNDTDCRKPAPGMLLAAARDMAINLAESWMIGDSPRDIEAGRRAGCRTILLAQTPPASQSPPKRGPTHVVASLTRATDLILGC